MTTDGAGAPKHLRLFNTLSREIQPVLPANGKQLRFYCCGPTVYGPAHIGNFRTFLLQDLFRRTIEALGIPTLHVRNITDVDDKTILGAARENLPLAEFTRRWTNAFHADCLALNLLPPHFEPSAVAHIPDQIALIEVLVQKGHAYRSNDGSVYFRISSFQQYGKLSRLAERQLQLGAASHEESPQQLRDEYERESVADFALWKARRPEDGSNFWQSPWGEGRPGWHIECSAMARKYLGDEFDVHGGGMDLIFPHHENEIAQSEAATCRCFARHWFHIAHLLVENRKMSKSLGNLYTLRDVLERGFTANELRYVLLSGHYRQPLNFTWDSLHAAQSALHRLAEFRATLPPARPLPLGQPLFFGEFTPVFDALLDDLNTPEALGRLFRIVRQSSRAKPTGSSAQSLADGLEALLWVFGLSLPQLPLKEEIQPPTEIVELAQKRWEAKRRKDWATADALRAQILELGWAIQDRPNGYSLHPSSAQSTPAQTPPPT